MVLHKTVDGMVSCGDWDDLCTTFLGEGRNRYTVAYVVFTDGPDTYAQNGVTGAIDYGGPDDNGTVDGGDADAVWNAALANTGAVAGETKIVDGCGMSYTINATLVIPSNVWLVNARFSLADNSDTHMIESYGFATHTGLNHWYVDTESVPYNIGLVNVHLYGNKGNQASGYGVRFYAKRYYVKNVIIRNVKQVGFYSECGDVSGQHDWRDIPTSLIDGLFITAADGIGFQFRGPHDSIVRYLEPSQNGGVGASFEVAATYQGFAFIGFLHSYGNTGDGVSLAAVVYAEVIKSDCNSGQDDIVVAGNGTIIQRVITGNATVTSARGLVISANRCSIDEVWAHDHTNIGVEISGDANQIGIIKVSDATTGGVLVSGEDNTILNIDASAIAAGYAYRTTGISNKLSLIQITAATVLNAIQIDGNGSHVLGGRSSATGDIVTLGVTGGVVGCYINVAALTTGYTNLINYFAGGSNNEIHAYGITAGAEVLVATTNPGTTDYFDCKQTGAAAARTRNRGTATILNGNNSIVVAHGLFSTPTKIMVTGTHAEVEACYVDTIGAANFTIHKGGAGNVTANRDIFWEAIV